MSKHTQGPWEYDRLEPGFSGSREEPPDPGYPAIVFMNRGDDSIELAKMEEPGYVEEIDCEYDDGWRPLGDPNANARLMAAAPDLLTVCQYWFGAVQQSMALRLALADLPKGAGAVLVGMLQEAIAKAEGDQCPTE